MTRRVSRSAALAAALAGAEVVLLTLFLNPNVVPRREASALVVSLFLPYALGGFVLLVAISLVARLLAGPRASRDPVPGFDQLLPLSLLALTASAWLFWLNLFTYRYSIPVEFVRGLAGSCVGLSASWLVLMAVAVDGRLFPGRERPAAAALVILALGAAVAVPLALRPQPTPTPRPVPLLTETVAPIRRIRLIGMDGLGPAALRDGIARGQLRSFARATARGAWGPLATFRPTEAPPIWTTIVTGRFPRDHGIKSFSTYRLRGSTSAFELLPKGALVAWLERAGLVETTPVTAKARKRRALWNAMNAFGISTGVVRFWGTHPPESVRGFMLSHYFHLLRPRWRQAEALHPSELLAEIQLRTVRPGEVDAKLLAQFVDLSADVPGDRSDWRRDLVERALAPDLTYERAGAVLRAAYDPPFFATYFYGLDVVGHAFMRYAQPDHFGNVSQVEVRRYGRVLDGYLEYLDRVVGEAAQGLGPGDVLLVVSGYGMEPTPLWRRALQAVVGAREMSGTHAGAPDGVILAVGDGVRSGAEIRGASLVDVAPTVLYLMGLPVARDMDGRVLTEILDEDFARAHPVSYIPSYESLAVTPLTSGLDLDLPPLPDEGG